MAKGFCLKSIQTPTLTPKDVRKITLEKWFKEDIKLTGKYAKKVKAVRY